MRKALSAAVILIAAVALLLWLFRAELAMRVMARVVPQNMATDRIAALPDGLHVAFCGAGSPMPDPVRSGPCIAVIGGRTLVVVDAGSNGARNLQRMGLGPGRIQAVFITHFHSDHIDGLGEMAMLRWVGGAHQAPLPVHGPPGIEQVVEGFNLAYRADAGYRTVHHGAGVAPPSGAGSRAMPFDLPASGERLTVWERDGLEVQAFAVGHEPVEPAVGFRFSYGGRSLVISGDTRGVPEMVEIARDTDLLLHEALAPHLVGIMTDSARTAGLQGLAKITADIVDYHASPVEAAGIAADSNARALVLYHIVPPLSFPGLEAAFLRGVGDRYDGPVMVARDGLLISLPAGSRDMRRDRLL